MSFFLYSYHTPPPIKNKIHLKLTSKNTVTSNVYLLNKNNAAYFQYPFLVYKSDAAPIVIPQSVKY